MKTKRLFVVLIAVLFAFVIAVSGFAISASADEVTETGTESVENGAQTGESGEAGEILIETTETQTEGETESEESVAENFVEYLKTVYGSNYEYYYNLIIDNWGSVEAYLLSISENLPEESQNSWEAFVSWLSEYASIWATILAAIVAIVFAYFQYRRTQKYKAQYTTLTEASNQQSAALLSVIEGVKSLLGNNEKFSEQAEALDKAIEELKKNV